MELEKEDKICPNCQKESLELQDDSFNHEFSIIYRSCTLCDWVDY